MNYDPDASPVRSLDVAGTKTPNRRRYTDPNCLLRLNGQGQPVAIRPVKGVGQSGSLAWPCYQVIKPNGIEVLSPPALKAWVEDVTHPVN